MLTVSLWDRNDQDWWVGQPPPGCAKGNAYRNITEVQADGHELQFIIDNFPNLPYPRGRRVVRWVGETAQFIVINLPHKRQVEDN